MGEEQRSLRAIYNDAESKRKSLDQNFDSTATSFQENVFAAIELYEQCVHIAGQISLFSPNESLEDINTVDLQYLLLSYRLAELRLRINNHEQRTSNLEGAQRDYERYLKQLDSYDMLSKAETQLFEHWREAPLTFSTASTTDAAARRQAKINRFKEEKALKQKLEYLRQNSEALQNDDDAHRKLLLTNIAVCTHEAFASLESIAQELHILSLAPLSAAPDLRQQQQPSDLRERNGRNENGYNERLDAPISHLSAGMRGPLLDSSGKPLRPFTLTSKRQEFGDGVFRPDHSLPTMSIDEYLEEERRRGGMIEGVGAKSGNKPVMDEDDMDAADRETMKAREWDEYVEANPKGSGNTLNRG